MNAEELSSALATINEKETELAGLRDAIQDGISRARAINASVRAGQDKVRMLDLEVSKLKLAVKEHNARERAREIEARQKAREAEEAKAKAEAEKAERERLERLKNKSSDK